jgi:hypothetical protein
VCNRHRSKPDFFALPFDAVAAQELLARHAARRLCICTATERASAVKSVPLSQYLSKTVDNSHRVNSRQPSIFSNKADERIYHQDLSQDESRLDSRDGSYNRPDLVFGLSTITNSLTSRLRQLQVKRYSPFQSEHTCCPFLVVEAKSEKGQGFDAIHAQSALSIRSCLKLQVHLKADSGNCSLNPLVWFIGFRGDEWRLYMTVPHDDETVSSRSRRRTLTYTNRMSLTAGMEMFQRKIKPCSYC